MFLQGFVDDSSAQTGEREFCLAGFMATAPQWNAFVDHWDDVLREPPYISYFHAADAQSRKEEFEGWTKPDRDKKVMQLAQVIEQHPLLSFDCRLSQQSFEAILLPASPYDLRSPYFILFFGVMVTAARQLNLLNIDVPIDFIFDEQGDVGPDADLWYGPIKAMQPPHLGRLLGARPIFRSDKVMIPLQAADCLAWHLRRSRDPQFRDEYRPALDILRKDSHVETWVPDSMLEDMADKFRAVANVRQHKGSSAKQFMKGIVGEVMKLPHDEQNGAYERFNEAMDTLLKADPAKVKAAMETEKKEREETRKAKRAYVSGRVSRAKD